MTLFFVFVFLFVFFFWLYHFEIPLLEDTHIYLWEHPEAVALRVFHDSNFTTI